MADLEQARKELEAFISSVYEEGHISRLDRERRVAKVGAASSPEELALELAAIKRALAESEMAARQGAALVAPVPSGTSEPQIIKVHHGSLDRRKGPWLERDRLLLDLAHASAHMSLLEMGEGGRLEDIELYMDVAHSSVHLVVHEGTRIVDELEKEGANVGMNGRLKRSMADSFYTIRIRGSIKYSNLYFQAK